MGAPDPEREAGPGQVTLRPMHEERASGWLWAPLVLFLLLPFEVAAGSLRTEINGVRVELASEPERPVQGRETAYTLWLRDGASRPMTGTRATLMGRMPDGMTVLAPLRPGSEPGMYRGQVVFTMEGRWDLTLRVSGPERSFELSLTEQVGR